jgi:hypothetical protein
MIHLAGRVQRLGGNVRVVHLATALARGVEQ